MLAALALSAAALGAWRRRVEAMKPRTLGHAEDVEALVFTPRGDVLLTVSGRDFLRPQTLSAWAEPGGRLLEAVTLPPGGVTDLSVAPGGDAVALAHLFGELTVRTLPGLASRGPTLRGGGISAVEITRAVFSSVRFSPSGARAAINGCAGSLRVWSLADGRDLLSGPAAWSSTSGEPVEDCRAVLGFLSEDEVAYVGSDSLAVWSISKRERETLLARGAGFNAVASPRGTLWIDSPPVDDIGASELSYTARARRLPGGEAVGPPVSVPADATLAFSPGDALLAIASRKGLTIQEVVTGSVIFTHALPGDMDRAVTAVAFSPTADRVAVALGTKVFVIPFRR